MHNLHKEEQNDNRVVLPSMQDVDRKNPRWQEKALPKVLEEKKKHSKQNRNIIKTDNTN